tara:strand:+ start:9528 stop:10436 length:909 start_codon:yes stop_codon:yes gene_type:complete
MNKNQDIRDIFFNNIKKIYEKDKKFYILTNDADVHSLRALRSQKRFIDAGVAEQNLINIASGLSYKNSTALIYGFCTFLTFRCYEQIKFSLASHKSNTKIVGIGPGYSFSNDGPTHHGIQDLYLMYLIPEMEVINIADNNLANLISKKIKSIKGPTYIRLDKGVLNVNQKIKYNLNDGFAFTVKSKIKTNLIISSGYFCNLANDVAKKEKNLSVINFFKFKNFNEIKFINNIKKYKKIIIYDENTISGGITPIVMKIFNKYNLLKNIKVLASPDEQLFKYSLYREELLKYLKIDKHCLRKLI